MIFQNNMIAQTIKTYQQEKKVNLKFCLQQEKCVLKFKKIISVEIENNDRNLHTVISG